MSYIWKEIIHGEKYPRKRVTWMLWVGHSGWIVVAQLLWVGRYGTVAVGWLLMVDCGSVTGRSLSVDDGLVAMGRSL